MKHLKSESKLSESDYLQAFTNALQVIIDDSSILLKTGETASISTQIMQIMNDGDTTYGRRVDLLVACGLDGNNNNDDDIEISSIEFKKSNVPTVLLQYQQN